VLVMCVSTFSNILQCSLHSFFFVSSDCINSIDLQAHWFFLLPTQIYPWTPLENFSFRLFHFSIIGLRGFNCLLSSWNYRCELPHPACFWHRVNFFHWAGLELQSFYLYLLSSWDYKCVLSCPIYFLIDFFELIL
jgi:hypothetical protein